MDRVSLGERVFPTVLMHLPRAGASAPARGRLSLLRRRNLLPRPGASAPGRGSNRSLIQTNPAPNPTLTRFRGP